MNDPATYYIEQWQHRLGLDDWLIKYNPRRKVSKTSLANNSHVVGLQVCEIGIQDGCPDREIEGCVVHELLHLVIAQLENKALAMAGLVANEAVSIMLLDETHDIIENTVEDLTRALIGRKTMPFGKRMAKEFGTMVEGVA